MNPLFSRITNAFQSLTGGAGASSVVGIDIGSSSIKVVQLKTRGGVAVLETYGEIALGPYANQPIGKVTKLPPEKLSEALSDLIREANVTANYAAVSIPFSSSLISVIEMPKVDDEQLRRMIPIEARKYIPVPVSEVMLDWFAIPEGKSEPDAFDRVEKETMLQKRGQEILLVAIQNEVLRTYQGIMKNLGLNVGFYEIEIFSAIRSALGHISAPIAVVDIGASTSKVYVVEQGVVRATHLISVGSQQVSEMLARSLEWTFDKAERMKREWGFNHAGAFSDAENARVREALLSTLNRVFADVNRVLLTYGKRYNKTVSHIVFTGGGASIPGLAPIAQQALSAQVDMADPFAHVEAPAFLAETLKSIGPGFSVAIGVALRRLSQG
jgi:type IV pilus assembly protein PilM